MIEWYLVVANHLGMKTVEASLNALGCQVYYPREKILVTRLNKRIKIERSLLYKYIFVGKGREIRFYDIREAKGVAQLLDDMNGRPAQIESQTIERFQRNERYGKYDYTSRSRRQGLLKVDARVRVLDGQFEGYTGIVRRCSGSEKARIFLANKFVVHIPIDSLAYV